MSTASSPTAKIGFSTIPVGTPGQLGMVNVSVQNTSPSGSPTLTFGVDGSLNPPTSTAKVGYWSYTTVSLAPGQEKIVALRTVTGLPSGYSSLTSVFRVVYGGQMLDSIQGTMEMHQGSSTTTTISTQPTTTSATGSALVSLTPTNIAIGVAGLGGLALIGWALLSKPKRRYAPQYGPVVEGASGT